MKTKVYLLLLLLPSLALRPKAVGQNLVPNPSFEEYGWHDCLEGVSYYILDHWTYPDCAGQLKCFNSCSNLTSPSIGVPNNGFGYQPSHSGEGYVGFETFNAFAPSWNPRTYISIDLLTPLVGGEEYCVRFWLSVADISNFKTGILHAYLSSDVPSVCNLNDTSWAADAAVTFDITGVDTSAWHLIEGSFIASGSESTLTIGSFLFGAEIDTVQIGYEPFENIAMYFIDDVYLGTCVVGMAAGTAEPPIRLWPNPANDVVSIAIPADLVGSELQIMDALGRSVLRAMLDEAVNSIDVTGLSNGLYRARIEGSGAGRAVAFTIDQE